MKQYHYFMAVELWVLILSAAGVADIFEYLAWTIALLSLASSCACLFNIQDLTHRVKASRIYPPNALRYAFIIAVTFLGILTSPWLAVVMLTSCAIEEYIWLKVEEAL